jgi:histidyl-tRNA synthetase
MLTAFMAAIQTVKGFRDFYPEDCARRNFIFDTWRRVARGYGFVEYEGPLLEMTDLFRKKSGAEITGQLFCFEDKAGRELSMRPEVTPSLARMAAKRQRDFKKPLKWFQIGPCFRYEEPQEGRSREFIQFNADILGESSPAADAELVAMAIDTMLAFGVGAEDFAIRLSNRQVWSEFLQQRGIDEAGAAGFLQIIDKVERARPEETAVRLEPLGISLEEVREFMAGVNGGHPAFAPLRADLEARGLWHFVRIDATIVRGLAYYTGTVFEVFDLSHGLRAVAGGGRYDQLCALMSDGKADMPAAGFAMGDVVLGILLERTPGAQFKLLEALRDSSSIDAYVVVADENARGHALAALQEIRRAGLRADAALSPAKMGKQFQAAEERGARFAVVFGAEFPLVTVKNLTSRTQETVEAANLPAHLAKLLEQPDHGPLIAKNEPAAAATPA